MRKHVGWLDGGDEQVLGPGRLQGGRLQPPDVDVQTFLLEKKFGHFFLVFRKFCPRGRKTIFPFQSILVSHERFSFSQDRTSSVYDRAVLVTFLFLPGTRWTDVCIYIIKVTVCVCVCVCVCVRPE